MNKYVFWAQCPAKQLMMRLRKLVDRYSLPCSVLLLSPLSCGLFRPTFRIPQKYCQQKKATLVLPFVLPLSWRITQKYQVDQKFIVKKSWER